MPRTKDDRRIVKGVHLPIMPEGHDDAKVPSRDRPKANTFQTFVEGQEDELEAHMTPEQMERLQEQGVIDGDGWKPGSAKPEAVKAVQQAREAERREAEERAAQPQQPKRGQQQTSPAKNYAELHVDELHAEASRRNIEGRSELKTHDQLVKALEKHDRDAAKKS